MNNSQDKDYRMFIASQTYLDNFTQTWNTIPRIVNYKNDFDELIMRITEKDEATGSSVFESCANMLWFD